MNTLLVYMFKAALYLTAFYLIYSPLLSRDASYARNRAFILLSLAAAMILPCFAIQNIKLLNIQFFGKSLADVFVTASSGGDVKLNHRLAAFDLLHAASLLYLAGAAVFTVKLLSDLISLLVLIHRKKSEGSRIIRFHGFHTSAFSAMGYVFINERLRPEETAEIIKHEQNHLRRNHFVDIIFVGIVKAFQWFNPSIYLFNRSLRAIHEYQADQECIKAGIEIVNYQNILLNQVFKTNTFTLTNSFSNPSLIKKRMIMMTKKPASAIASMKILFVIPVIGIVFLFVSAFGKANTARGMASSSEVTGPRPEASEMTPFVEVEEMPMFPGGDEALLNFLAKKNNIKGRVVLRFCVAANGTVNRVSVLQGVDPELDAEAIRVVKTLPPFTPGKQGGKAVPVWYMVPITFSLK